MVLPAGTHRLGPGNASLQVRTYRDGVAAKVGHDLVLDVTRWEATLHVAADPARSTVELRADARSLQVRAAAGGVKPLTDRDRDEIVDNIEKVLHGAPIAFRSRAVRPARGAAALVVEGELTIGELTRPLAAELAVDEDDGVAGATITLAQSDWGMRPYRGLMGALKVRDEVEIVVSARLGPS